MKPKRQKTQAEPAPTKRKITRQERDRIEKLLVAAVRPKMELERIDEEIRQILNDPKDHTGFIVGAVFDSNSVRCDELLANLKVEVVG